MLHYEKQSSLVVQYRNYKYSLRYGVTKTIEA